MAEAVDEVLAIYGPTRGPAGVLAGMREAWAETLEAPDLLARML